MFRAVILQETQFLVQHGYMLSEKESSDDVIVYERMPTETVRCVVEFDLKEYFKAPIRRFGIMLWREQLGDVHSIHDLYVPMIVSLENLMRFGFGIEVFSDDKRGWEFTNEDDLRKEISYAKKFLLEYGLSWVEDPHSRTHWRNE